MESAATFRTTIISNYTALFETVTINRLGHPKKVRPSEVDMEAFRKWLVWYIINAEIYDPYAGRISGKDVITNDALKKQSVPPYTYLYPSLRRAISVLPKETLSNILGYSFAESLLNSL